MKVAAIPGLEPSRQQQLHALFDGQPHLQAVWLFGSRALGRYREGSDIDLCLEGEGFTHRDHLCLLAAIDDLLMPWQVDLVLKQHMPADLLDHVNRVGICIWRRSPSAMAEADVRWIQRLDNYGRALGTLQRALQIAQQRPLSELEEQGLIQAFEFTHELSWLLIKDFLADQGVSGISGSRDAVREAVVRELLPEGSEATWMAMIRSRKLTSHTYNPALAHEIASLIQLRYVQELLALEQVMRVRAQARQ